MSKHIVIATFGSFGDVNPYLGLALRLKQQGHRPVIATAEFYRSYIEDKGIGFHPIRPDVDLRDVDEMRRIMDPKRGTEYLFKEFLFPRVRESYEDLSDAVRGADLLITHPVTFAGPLVAEKEGLPWASTVLAPISFFSAHDPPVTSLLWSLAALRRFGSSIGLELTRYYGHPNIARTVGPHRERSFGCQRQHRVIRRSSRQRLYSWFDPRADLSLR